MLLGNYYNSSIDVLRLNPSSSAEEITAIRALARKASLHDPLEGRYRFTYADAEWLLHNTADAIEGYAKAARLDPANGEYLQKLGLAIDERGEADSAKTLLRFGTVADR